MHLLTIQFGVAFSCLYISQQWLCFQQISINILSFGGRGGGEPGGSSGDAPVVYFDGSNFEFRPGHGLS
jgi:hypothetical protein